MSKWTNVFNLPGPLVEVIEHDLYTQKRGAQLAEYKAKHGLPLETPHFSVSDLIKPPRMRLLINRHFDEIVRLIREARSMVAAARLHWTP